MPIRAWGAWLVAVVVVAGGVLDAKPAAAAGAAESLIACKDLVDRDQAAKAVPRCEEAAASGLAEAHLLLGRAHATILGIYGGTPPASAADRDTHRTKGMTAFRSFLGLPKGTGDPVDRVMAIAGLLSLYVAGEEKDDTILVYVQELASLPVLIPEHAVYLAAACRRHGRFDDAVAVLERSARTTPRDVVGYRRLAGLLWDKAYGDTTLAADRRAEYIERGLAHADNALAIHEGDFEALTYKGLLLRAKARDARNAEEQQPLIQRAVELQGRAVVARGAGGSPVDPHAHLFPLAPPAAVAAGPAPRSPEVPALALSAPPFDPPVPSGTLRVGGVIKEPKKIKDASPVYPSIAQQARVQGVVILECLVGVDGKVKQTRVLRSIPLLDRAAVDAVLQWEFEPTVWQGEAVPVLMTVTVNFTLS